MLLLTSRLDYITTAMQRRLVCQSISPTDSYRLQSVLNAAARLVLFVTEIRPCDVTAPTKSFTGYEYRSESITNWRFSLSAAREYSSHSRRRLTSAPAVSDDELAGRSFYTLLDPVMLTRTGHARTRTRTKPTRTRTRTRTRLARTRTRPRT